MKTLADLQQHLLRLEGKGYKAYKAIVGEYDAGAFRLVIDHVQGDPFAEPSRVRAILVPTSAALPHWAWSSPRRRVAAGDFLNRIFHGALREASTRRGSGKSGELRVLRPGQEVLSRTSVLVRDGGEVEARFRVGLPARGRRIQGREAAELFAADLVPAVEAALRFPALDGSALRRHVETVEDARALRDQLHERDLVAFVADGAVLPRRSGVDDRPLAGDRVVPFRSPESSRVTLEAPNAGDVTGMGVPKGVTLIVGGGYHGKSTLLRAIERGVYDHIPGDGRERVVAVAAAVKVRAEDGRRIAGVDISSFIDGLPGGQDTRRFETENASGSTSQAAAIAEALEVGAECLCIDEDTSATNFMIRDARMQALIADEHEPITPYIDRARPLAGERGVSTILVIGGAGDYFDVADTVIAMRNYLPEDVTEEARRIAERLPSVRRREGGPWRESPPRVPIPESIDPSRGKKAVRVRTRELDRVSFGSEEVELSAVEQLVERAQTRAIAEALVWARGQILNGRVSLAEGLRRIMEAVERDGLDVVHPYPVGELAEFRIFELAAFLNRLRSLRVR